MFQKHKIQIGVTGEFKYFASLFGNGGFNPSVATIVRIGSVAQLLHINPVVVMNHEFKY